MGTCPRPAHSSAGDHVCADGHAAALSVLTLADVGGIIGRNDVPESTVGGETTCIVCMARPKTHLAVPSPQQSACGTCAERMQLCPYCCAPVEKEVAPGANCLRENTHGCVTREARPVVRTPVGPEVEAQYSCLSSIRPLCRGEFCRVLSMSTCLFKTNPGI